MKIGFVGLGNMGFAMASSLIRNGQTLIVHNRTRDKARPLVELGALVVDSPAQATEGVDAVVTMLPDDAALEQVTLGEDGILAALGPDAVHVSSSTISPRLSQRLGRLHTENGRAFVAAPVLGRPEAAAQGRLVVVAAGPARAVERCRPIFDALGSVTHVVGEHPPRANAVKLAVNFVLASLLATLGEAYALVEEYGMDDRAFLEILNGSLLKSPIVEAYGAKIADGSFDSNGFRLELGAKDVRLAVEAAEAHTVPMPIASVLRESFVAAMAAGEQDVDWSAIGRVNTRRAS